MIRLLHISDVHMDRPFSTKEESVSLKLKKAIRRSFTSAVDFCIQREVDFLVISGDLFDSETVSPESAIFLFNELKRLADQNIEVIYATGNHDSTDRITELRYFKWPANVTMFSGNEHQIITKQTSEGESATFIGIGYDNKSVTDNKIAAFPKRSEMSPELISSCKYFIGVAHTQISNGFFESGNYMPCSLDDLKALEYDYFALGHVHKREFFEGANAAYSGSLQALKIDELGKRGGILMEFDSFGVKRSFVNFVSVVFEKVSVDISGSTTLEEALRLSIQAIDSKVSEIGIQPEDACILLDLYGPTIAKAELQSQETIDAIKDEVRLKTRVIDLKIGVDRISDYIFAKDYDNTENILGYIVGIINSEDELDEISEKVYQNINEKLNKTVDVNSANDISRMIRESKDEIASMFVRD